ncbi:MAG: hypothetical protein EUB_00661 [Eubacterium sp.]
MAAVAMAAVFSVFTALSPVTVRAGESAPAPAQTAIQTNGAEPGEKEPAPATKAGDVAINEENFPDPAFHEYVKRYDENKDGSLSAAEIAKVTFIEDVGGKSEIKDLKGIEFFTALTSLKCYKTGITSLDVSRNTALTYLDCDGTKITALNVGENTALTYLYCNNTGITSLDIRKNKALKVLWCYNTGIKSLDVSENTALKVLRCYETQIENLDVSENTALENLNCNNTGITSLDVSENTALKKLYCSDTGITSLDVSKNTALEELYCSDTGITGLDVSKNTALKELYCTGCPLAWLDVSNTHLSTFDKPDPSSIVLTLGAGEDSFSIEEKLPGLDINRLSELSGAIFSGGRFTNYSSDTPIKYTYDCGNGEKLKVEITLKGLKAASSISITENLGKTYDGQPVSSTPAVTKTGSTGAVSYKWEKQKEDASREEIAGAPADAGTYRVTAAVAADDNHQGATSDAEEFTISKAIMTNTDIEIPIELKGNDGKELSTVTLPAGWTWADGTQELTHSNSGYEARLTVDDSNYDYTSVSRYNSSGHYVARTLQVAVPMSESQITITENLSKTYDGQPVNDTPAVTKTGSTGQVSYKWEKQKDDLSWEETTAAPESAGTYRVTATVAADDNHQSATSDAEEFTISKAANAWTGALDISDWTYGAPPNTAAAGFRFGQPRYLYSDRADGIFTEAVPTNAGTWYVKAVVDDTDDYEGAESEAVSFVIEPKSAAADSQITVPEIGADTDLKHLTLKDGDQVLVQGKDYDVTTMQDGDTVTVTITFKGNYTGAMTTTYTLSDKKPEDNAGAGSDKNKDTTSDKNSAGNGAVKTGYRADTDLWGFILVISGGLLAILAAKKRKEEKEDK